MKSTNKTKLVARMMLLVLLLASVVSLAGCDWDRLLTTTSSFKTTVPNSIELNDTQNTTETIFTTINDVNGEIITIAHGKDLVKDDIDFILELHGKKRNDLVEYDRPPHYKLSEVLTMVKKGKPFFLAHFENPYIICAYLKLDVPEYEINEVGDYRFDITKYVWYKFYNAEQVVDAINGMERTNDSYLFYDCTIERDIVNGVEYNKSCKYYMEYTGEHVLKRTTPDMLLYFDFTYWMTEGMWFVPYPEYSGSDFEVYVDENGAEYLYFNYRVYYEGGSEYENVAIDIWDEHYEYLADHFEALNETMNEDGLILQYAGIKLDELTKYLTDGR